MAKHSEQVFARFPSSEPPAGLFEKIMRRIREERRLLSAKRRLVIFSAVTLFSVAVFIPALKMAQTDVYESGFLQFLSLAFSDFGIAAAYWQNFASALLETIPAISLIILLAAIFTFLESLKILSGDIKIIFTLSNNR